MKIVIRIFNAIIVALAAVACVFLFLPPSFSFNSKITLDVGALSKFVPTTEYSKDIDIVELLGTDKIYCGIKFQLDMGGMGELSGGDKEKTYDTLITPNVDELLDVLHEPVDLITDLFIRDNMKKLISQQVTSYIDTYANSYREKNPSLASQIPSTAEIMDEVGMDDEYFTNFSIALYDESNSDTATVDSVADVLFEQVGEALGRASHFIDVSEFDDSQKSTIKTSMSGVYNSLGLVKADGVHLNKISQICYVYLSNYLHDMLKDTVDAATLERGATEDASDYSDRLVSLFIKEKMPDMVFSIIGYVILALYIALFVFAGIWAILAIITIIKSFTKKPWTIFGVWFWIVGAIELVLGFGVTAITKFALSKLNLASFGLPISQILVSIKTYALIPSIVFIVCIPLAIAYGFIKRPLKKQWKRSKAAEAPAK